MVLGYVLWRSEIKNDFQKNCKKNVFEFLVRKSYNAQRKSITGTKNKHSKAYHLCVFFDENFKTCLLKNLFKKIGELRANKIFF